MKYIRLYKGIKWVTILSAIVWGVNVVPRMLVISKMLNKFANGEAYNIDIIGGADGPTAIYLTTKTVGLDISYFAFGLSIVGCIILIILRYKLKDSL